MSSNQSVTESSFHHYLTLLEHIGQVGAEKILPFADNLGSLINGFVPGVGNTVALVIKAVAQAQSDAYQVGDKPGSGSQKMARVMASVSASVAKMLDDLGRPSDTEAVRAMIEQAVQTMKAAQVPALPSTKVSSDSVKSSASGPVVDQHTSVQAPQRTTQEPAAAPIKIPGQPEKK
jgi:hypothetical protein